MTYAMYQMDLIPGDPPANRDKVRRWLQDTLSRQPVDVAVLPELWTTAYDFSTLGETADSALSPTADFLQELAAAHQVNLIGGSIANRRGDGFVYNTAVVVDRRGNLAYTYDKAHLVPMLDEPRHFRGGETAPRVFSLDGVAMGLIICYDLRFPEIIRPLAVDGAKVLHVVAEWPRAREAHWTALLIARAVENGVYVAACNRAGNYNGTDFCGNSLLIAPDGSVLRRGGQGEETVAGALDLSMVEEMQRAIPVLDSRRPQLYR